VFDVAATSAEVEPVALARLADDVRAGRAVVLADDPYLVVAQPELLPAKHLQLREQAWRIVEGLTRREPAIFLARLRGQLIAEATALHGVSHPTIYRYLRRYWQRGQTPNALLPDYANSGGRGKERAASEGVKRGRPRKAGADPGLNADLALRRVFRVATALYAAEHAKFSRRGAYRAMLRDFFDGRRIDLDSGRVLPAAATVAVLPSFGQFNYWLERDDDGALQRRQRVGKADAGHAPLAGAAAATDERDERDEWCDGLEHIDSVGAAARPSTAATNTATATDAAAAAAVSATATASASATACTDADDMAPPADLAAAPGRPGASYYVEAVRAELQLVSPADRTVLAGRPLLYVVSDCFSGMVAGVYASLEPAGWDGAMLALANCGADKQRYCAGLGRAIDAAEWPVWHLPETLLVQSALGAGWNDDTLLHNFNVRCRPVADGPAGWKATLARRFNLLAPGEEGGANRLDGVLDLRQFKRVVLEAVLQHNRSGGAARREALAPRALWDWGLRHRGAGLKSYPEQLLRCCLLPLATASVTADGILLRGRLYTCARAIEQRWFERARQRGQWQVRLACDPSDLELVYLLDAAAPMQFHACHPLLGDAAPAPAHAAAAVAEQRSPRQPARGADLPLLAAG
jgi:putative transposase